MKRITLCTPLILAALFLSSCSEDDENQVNTTGVLAPVTYSFERNGSSSVSYSGQTERLKMVSELSSALLNFDKSVSEIQAMYANADSLGNDVDPFSDPSLNTSSKSVRSKTAASALYFSANTAESASIKADFDSWIMGQVESIFPYQNQAAAAGTPGQIADGTSARYVNAKGLEYNQAFIKGLIGALAADQMLNNYLDPLVLDAGSNRADNDASILVEGKNYTNMEHKWDEAYGYLFGGASDGSAPLVTLGGDDELLNKYLARVVGDDDFSGFATDIYNAFKLGRAAIVAGDYDLRDQQAAIIRERISEIIGIRAVYYLQSAKLAFQSGAIGTALHDLSEGYGFIYSLRFTHNPTSGTAYFSAMEVEQMLMDLMGDGANGLWDLSSTTIDQLSNDIANRFNFTVSQAAPGN